MSSAFFCSYLTTIQKVAHFSIEKKGDLLTVYFLRPDFKAVALLLSKERIYDALLCLFPVLHYLTVF